MLKVGFIGVGGIAQEHLNHVQKSGLATIVAVCDVNEAAAQGCAPRFGATAYTSHLEMLDRETLDAVFVCVPPFAHEGIEEAVIRRGVALFVEKPVALSETYAARIEQSIAHAKLLNSTGYCLRYWDIVQEAKRFLADRTIGMAVGFYTTTFVQAPWWRQMAKSGGQLVEQTTHVVDLLRYLVGEMTQVHANLNLVASRNIDGLDIPDVGSVNVRFANGAIGHIHTTFLSPDHRSGVEIYGPGYRLTIDGGQLCIVDHEKTVIKKGRNNFYETQDIAFLRAVEEQNPTGILAPYAEGRRTLAVTLAANESAKSGNVVMLRTD